MTLSKAHTITKAIGIYEIVGAVTGIAFCLLQFDNVQLNIFWFLYVVVALCFQFFFLYAGIQTVRLRPNGLTLSFFSQLAQLVAFHLFGFRYVNVCGLGLLVGMDLTQTFDFAWNFYYSTGFRLGYITDSIQRLQVNLIALLLLFAIEKIRQVRETSVNTMLLQ